MELTNEARRQGMLLQMLEGPPLIRFIERIYTQGFSRATVTSPTLNAFMHGLEVSTRNPFVIAKMLENWIALFKEGTLKTTCTLLLKVPDEYGIRFTPVRKEAVRKSKTVSAKESSAIRNARERMRRVWVDDAARSGPHQGHNLGHLQKVKSPPNEQVSGRSQAGSSAIAVQSVQQGEG